MTVAQCTRGEADDLLDRLLSAGVLERFLDGSRSFRLTGKARDDLRSRITYRTSQLFDDQWETIRALFDLSPQISSNDVRTVLELKTVSAVSRVLKRARQLGLVAVVDGRERGRGVRYTLTETGRTYPI